MTTYISSGSRVAVCIATFRRSDRLRELLRALEGQGFREGPELCVAVVVADNEPESGEAAAVCGEFANGRRELIYTPEPRQGISFARNRAVTAARAWGAELVAFIDDDEIPQPFWLDELLRLQRSTGASAVAGPVLPEFGRPVPTWVTKGGFFERPRYPTGTALKGIRTGNLLLSLAELHGELFDEAFALTGSEDAYLSAKLLRAGSRMVWADEAIVVERVPPSRTNARWLLRRAFAGGCNWARIERLLDPGLGTAWVRAAKGLAHIAIGLATAIPSTLFGPHAIVRCGIRVCAGAGSIFGLFGYRSERYRADKVSNGGCGGVLRQRGCETDGPQPR